MNREKITFQDETLVRLVSVIYKLAKRKIRDLENNDYDGDRLQQKGNAPLRATLNGQLVSVPETLYDYFIIREIAAEDEVLQEAIIVGRTFGKFRLGIGDQIASKSAPQFELRNLFTK